MITVLCVSKTSYYKTMTDVDCWDVDRDARNFNGPGPIIAHPPCRLWSTFCRHQAKPVDAESEKALGLHCVDLVRRHGGILEQPAFSHLWEAADLPKPGSQVDARFWSAEVWQSWWGFPAQKRTWLLFSQIHPDDVDFPFGLVNKNASLGAWNSKSKRNREKTIPAFAEWLVETAKKTPGQGCKQS